MVDEAADVSFFLDYELSLDDIAQVAAANGARRKRRVRVAVNLVSWLLVACSITAVTLALDHASTTGTDGAPSWLYVAGIVGWYLVVIFARIFWRLGPDQVARRAWRSSPGRHGRHQDKVAADGVTSTAPDGTTTFIPWSGFTGVREIDSAFLLLGKAGSFRVSLPKRGLHAPSLPASLGEFMRRAIDLRTPSQTRTGG